MWSRHCTAGPEIARDVQSWTGAGLARVCNEHRGDRVSSHLPSPRSNWRYLHLETSARYLNTLKDLGDDDQRSNLARFFSRTLRASEGLTALEHFRYWQALGEMVNHDIWELETQPERNHVLAYITKRDLVKRANSSLSGPEKTVSPSRDGPDIHSDFGNEGVVYAAPKVES